MEKLNNGHIPYLTIPKMFELRPKMLNGAHALMGQHLIALCDTTMESLEFPCHINTIIISLCREGECELSSNLHNAIQKKGSMFLCAPQTILQIKSMNNFRVDVLVIDPDFLKQTKIDIKHMMPLVLEFEGRPCLPLDEKDFHALHSLIELIEQEMCISSETTFTCDIIKGLVDTSIMKVADILMRILDKCPKQERVKRNRTDEYFKQFMYLLGKYYKEEHSVGFYAKEMCITSKYLTTLIRTISGKSASDWIDDYVILEAKALLKYSNMSIQEIAYYLSFSNQSFFGSYFKRNTGLSPSQYKAQ